MAGNEQMRSSREKKGKGIIIIRFFRLRRPIFDMFAPPPPTTSLPVGNILAGILTNSRGVDSL
jgi:hypothetical protein